MLDLNKGDKVIVKGFTGIKLGVFEVAAATKKTLTVLKKNGDEMIFDRKTGRQINTDEGKEKYANSIIEDDGSFVAPTRKSKKAAKPAKKAPKAKPEPEDDDEEEDEEEAPAPKSKKTTKTAPAKKPAKKPVVEDDEDEDDDDFEEVD